MTTATQPHTRPAATARTAHLVLWAFVLVLFWGNACEQLEYSEY